MTKAYVLTDFDILEICKRAVERRRAKQLQKCYDAIDKYGEDYVKKYISRCWEWIQDPYTLNVFTKADFIVCARSYLRENRLVVKVETLLRRLRKLAEVQRGIRYVDKRKGLYELIEE